MDCSFKWTILCLAFLALGGAVHSQNHAGQSYQVDANREPNQSTTRSQLMNTLLTIAAANGVLPDLLPVIQPSEPRDSPKTLNLIQLSPNQRPQEPVVVTGKPLAPNQAVVTPIANPYSYHNIPLQTTFTPRQTQSNVCPASQAESPTVPTRAGIQAIPASWQPNRSDWQPIPEPTNLHIPSYVSERVETQAPEYEHMNFHINLPSQSPPHITVVSPNRTPESLPSHYPYHPPIVIERGDSLNNILPIMLVALIANERDNCGCNCCCSCSRNVVPIPYPIPFPINSPVIAGSKNSEKSSKEDEGQA